MNDLMQDIRFAARQMARKPGITAFAVLSLALGIGVNSSIFSLVNAVLMRSLPAVRPAELVDVYVGQTGEFRYATSSFPDYADLRTWNDTVSDLAAFNVTVATWDNGRRTELLFGEEVTASYFDLLGLRPVLGRTFLPEEDATAGTHPVIVLGQRAWKQRFGGDPNIIGRSLKLNGMHFTVIGVAPEKLKGSFPGVVSEFFMPMQMADAMEREPTLTARGSRSLFLKARLKPGIPIEKAQAQFTTFASRLRTAYPVEDKGLEITLVKTRNVVLNPGIDGPIIGVAGLLMGLVGLVLLIACSNVANLLLVRASERRKEIAIRLAIGAGRGRLIRQLLTESVMLALMGGALGLLFALWTARLIVAFKPPLAIPLSLDVALDVKVLAFTMGLALLTGLICGVAPALQASKPDLVGTLRDDSAGPGRRYRRLGLRNLLVITQVAISTVLLVGAGLFLRSLGQASSIDPGFTLRKGVAAQLLVGLGGSYTDAQGRVFYQRLLERTRALPGVRSAAYADHLPLALQVHVSRADIEGKPTARDEDKPEIDLDGAGPGYFETLGIPILAGRPFNEHDGPDVPKVAIVNETSAKRFWPGESPLGKHFRVGGKDAPWLTVVGVARDGKYRTLGEDPRPFAYTMVDQDKSFGRTLIVAGNGDEKALLGQVRRAIDATDPNVPIFDIKTMSEHLSIMLFLARIGAVLLAAFGGLGLILASMGLYGVVAASVARRTREIGIRMAIGARRGDVLRLVVREGMVLTGTGLAIGLGLALLGTGLLHGLLYGIAPSDPLTFAAVALVLGGVALGANLIPAKRATEVDPLVALRSE
ncbi:MAG TPA: ABC transporter permease [Thermoanaerobaculia bacterium]|jgi:predicted permease|nr:ABC transporter permease [Thermoanaerobaculia bacterium]